MPEIQLASHTVRSHGIKVLRIHMHDWLILLVLAAIDLGLNLIEPFHRFVGEDMMTDLKYPLKDNTVPFWGVPIIAVLLPLAVILVYYFIRKDVYDLHHAILGLLFSIFITAVLTDAIKDGVGRPRPDFFWRCFPDGKGVFHPITKNVMCTGSKSVIKEGHKSFPSGHTSCKQFDISGKLYIEGLEIRDVLNVLYGRGSFAGLGFIAWYLSGKVRVFDRRGHVAKLCIVFLPLLLAAMVAVSRVDDYWHHWQDVFAGGLIGITIASFCYLQFFPPPYDTDGWGPHAYFQMLAESQNRDEALSANANSLSVQQTELESIYIQSQHGVETPRGYRGDTNPILNGRESGRRSSLG